MSDTRHESQSLIGGTAFDGIIKGLREHPLYLLIFGIIFTALVLCIYAFVAVDDATLRRLAAGGFIVLGIVVIVVIRSIELDRSRQRADNLQNKLEEAELQAENRRKQLALHDVHEINLTNDAMRGHYLAAIENTRDALAYKNTTFLKEVTDAIAAFETVTEDWSKGHLLTDEASYERILCEFYSTARSSVFATSNENYMDLWQDKNKEERILNAHRKAYEAYDAIVTRVFVFGSINNIEPMHLDIMRRQAGQKFIRAKILITDENKKISLSPYIVKDFAIIDAGEPTQTIGIESSGTVSSVATWIFGRDPQLEISARNMEFASISLERLEERLAAG